MRGDGLGIHLDGNSGKIIGLDGVGFQTNKILASALCMSNLFSIYDSEIIYMQSLTHVVSNSWACTLAGELGL